MKSLVPTEPEFDRKVEEHFVNADTNHRKSQQQEQHTKSQMRMRGELSDEEIEHSFGGEIININGKKASFFFHHIRYIKSSFCVYQDVRLK